MKPLKRFLVLTLVLVVLGVQGSMVVASPLGLSLGENYQFPNRGSSVTGFRLSLIGASHRNVNGFDLGPLSFNTVGESFRGIQLGLSNDIRRGWGLQSAILNNLARQGLAGIQLALHNQSEAGHLGFQVGGLNRATHLDGLQVGVFSSQPGFRQGRPNGLLRGAQLGLVTYAYEGGLFQVGAGNFAGFFSGLQVAGLNVAHEASGVQLGGINSSQDGHTGIQAGGFNLVANLTGVQVGGINATTRRTEGLQLSGANFARGLGGLQVGGLNFTEWVRPTERPDNKQKPYGYQVGGYNHARYRLRGVQIGLLNYGERIHGYQVGIINMSGHLQGLQVGLINGRMNPGGKYPDALPLRVFPLINWNW